MRPLNKSINKRAPNVIIAFAKRFPQTREKSYKVKKEICQAKIIRKSCQKLPCTRVIENGSLKYRNPYLMITENDLSGNRGKTYV